VAAVELRQRAMHHPPAHRGDEDNQQNDDSQNVPEDSPSAHEFDTVRRLPTWMSVVANPARLRQSKITWGNRCAKEAAKIAP
jgi:hypothetical protein